MADRKKLTVAEYVERESAKVEAAIDARAAAEARIAELEAENERLREALLFFEGDGVVEAKLARAETAEALLAEAEKVLKEIAALEWNPRKIVVDDPSLDPIGLARDFLDRLEARSSDG